MMLRFSILFTVAVLAGFSQANAATGIKEVDFCTVVKTPAQYDKQMISTKGILLPGGTF